MLNLSPTEATSNFSAWLNFIGLENIPEWMLNENVDSWMLVGIVVLVLLVILFPKIKKYFEKSEIKEEIPPIDHPEPVKENAGNKHKNFNSLLNNELRDAALDLAKNMYSFEANHNEANRRRSFSESNTKIPRHEAWEKERIRSEKQRAEFSTEFMTRYRPDAVAIRHELARRLGIFPPYENQDVVLDHGMLAGLNPIAEAADLISELARRLP